MDPIQQHPLFVIIRNPPQLVLGICADRAFRHLEPLVCGFVCCSVQRFLVSLPCVLVLLLGHALWWQLGFALLFVLHVITFAAKGYPTDTVCNCFICPMWTNSFLSLGTLQEPLGRRLLRAFCMRYVLSVSIWMSLKSLLSIKWSKQS